MDIVVQTGQTKTEGGVKLLPLPFTSAQGERVLALLQVQGSPQEVKTLEKEYTAIIQQSLLETEGDASARLDGALKELNGLMRGLMLSRAVDEVHAIMAIVDGRGVLHVSHAGRAEAYVIRGGVASQITEYSRGKPTPAFVHIASGELLPRDIVICSTQRLLRTLTPAQLSQLSQRGDQLLSELTVALDAEKEHAALGVFLVEGGSMPLTEKASLRSSASLSRRRGRGEHRSIASFLPSVLSRFQGLFGSLARVAALERWAGVIRGRTTSFLADLKHPKRKRRAHLLLVAGTIALFLLIWVTVNLTTSSQRRQTKAELEQLVEQISGDIQTAENRHLTGDIDAANAILQRAEERAKQVMDNETGLFRMEALDLLARIRATREEINNVIRLSPRVIVNLSAKNQDIVAQGFIGLAEGEFVVFDRQDLYRVLLNAIDDPDRLTDEELILDGVYFGRYQTQVYQTTGNNVIEIIGGQPTSMKTEDAAGWITGKDVEAYLRYLYVLSPENNQIYKYERLSNRYAAPAQYNVNGDLSGALDMALDGNAYVLKQGGEVVKLFRGEAQPFAIRYIPEGALKEATRIFKRPDGNFYFLDPVHARVIVATGGGATGESSYVRQFVLEGDQIGTLQDLYVDPDEAHLYLLDEKRIYAVDLGTK